MRIADILGQKGSTVITIEPGAPVAVLVDRLREHNLGAVVVSSDGEHVVGMVSERDVVRRLADGAGVLDASVAEIMSTEVSVCRAADTVDAVMGLMTERRIRHVPVVDDLGRLTGLVSIGDAVKSRITDLQFERDQLEDYVRSGQ